MIAHNIKNFLHQIELTNKKHYFLLYKFYLNPSMSLGGNNKSTLKNYNNYGDIKYLILNNVFCGFLKLCLQEPEFTKKLDNILLTKIRYLLLDSKECSQNYCPELYDPKIQYLITHPNNIKKKQ